MKKNIEEQKIEIYRQIEELLNLNKRPYNRVLTTEEKQMIGADAFGYLLSLYNYGTIDHLKLEKLIYCCVYIAGRRDEQLSLERTKPLVNMLLFYENSLFFAKELLPLLNTLEEQAFFETVN